MSGKPVVEFVHDDYESIVLGRSAIIQPLDHPSPRVSNKTCVFTSPVVQTTETEDGLIVAFETENTIYIRR